MAEPFRMRQIQQSHESARPNKQATGWDLSPATSGGRGPAFDTRLLPTMHRAVLLFGYDLYQDGLSTCFCCRTGESESR